MEQAVEASETGRILASNEKNLVQIITNHFFVIPQIPVANDITVTQVRVYVSGMSDNRFYQEIENCMRSLDIDETIIQLYLQSG